MSKRVNLTIPDEEYSILQRYAEALGTTPSTVGRDLLCQVSQSMRGVVEALDAAGDDKQKAILLMQAELMKGIASSSSESVELQKEFNL
jgi:hypothetical protein